MGLRSFMFRISDSLRSKGRDWMAVIISVVLAFVIWIFYSLSDNFSTLMRIDVQAVCDIDGHSNVSSNSVSVAARCNASGFTTLSARLRSGRGPVQVEIPISYIHQRSDEEFFVTSSALNSLVEQIFGTGVALEGFVSDTLVFRFPTENNKKVPVTPVSVIRYRAQYMEMSPMRTTPDSVLVYGDPKALSRIKTAYTKPIRYDDVHGGLRGAVALDLPQGVRAGVEEVGYTLDVQRYVETSAKLTIEFRGMPPGVRLRAYPSEADVTLRCLFPITYDPLTDLHLVVNYEDFKASLDGNCVATLEDSPDGLINYKVEPGIIKCLEVGQ